MVFDVGVRGNFNWPQDLIDWLILNVPLGGNIQINYSSTGFHSWTWAWELQPTALWAAVLPGSFDVDLRCQYLCAGGRQILSNNSKGQHRRLGIFRGRIQRDGCIVVVFTEVLLQNVRIHTDSVRVCRFSWLLNYFVVQAVGNSRMKRRRKICLRTSPCPLSCSFYVPGFLIDR